MIQTEIKKIERNGVTPAELKMAQDHVRGSLALSLEDSSDRAEFFGRQELFFGRVRTPQERLKAFDGVTRASVHKAAKEILHADKMALCAIGPYATPNALLKTL